MLTIYLIALFTGGVLVFGSAMSGLGSDVGDLEFDADVDFDMDGGAETGLSSIDILNAGVGDLAFDDGPSAGGMGEALAGWLPILSLRFWTFFGTFFGAAGVSLATMTDLSASLVLGTALGFGYLTGLSATRLITKLQRRAVSSSLTEDDYFGQIGHVLIAVEPKQMGKVRLHIRGRALDCFALTDAPSAFKVGAPIQVTDIDSNGHVTVAAPTQMELA